MIGSRTDVPPEAAARGKSRLNRALHWAGGTFALAGGVFVVFRLREHAAGLDFDQITHGQLAMLAGLAVIYGAANLLLALAWRHLLAFCRQPTSRTWAVYAYGISQLGKYVPGNIFHVAGRQAIGMGAGYSGWALARSTLWELGLISVTGALFGLLAVCLILRDIPPMIAIAAFLLALALGVWGLSRRLSREVAVAMAQQALFLAVSGAVFVGCLLIALPQATLPVALLPAIAGAFVLAWLVGLVTPGAPAGLGVRELVLLFLLAGIGHESDVLLAILLGRIVNVLGDVLFFGYAAIIRRVL